MSSRPIWITGLGAVSPGGHSAEETWQTVVSGRSVIKYLERFPVYETGTRIGGIVPGFELDPGRRSLALEFGRTAATEALNDAELSAGDRTVDLIIAGTHGEREIVSAPESVEIISAQEIARQLADHVGADEGMAVFGACAAGAVAIAAAVQLVRCGAAEVVLAGGADCLIRDWDYYQFCNLYAMSTRDCPPEEACCPFDKRRDGFVIGEGAGFFVLESETHASARGARPRAILEGVGYSQNAHHITASPPDAVGPSLAMNMAIRDAGLCPEDINYINAHGTATPDNDWCETLAIRKVFGASADAVPVSSSKSEIGHATGAAGAIEAVICVRALEEGLIPPTINVVEPDENCDLDYVPWKAREANLNHVLTNSFGFGGQNASLVLGRVP